MDSGEGEYQWSERRFHTDGAPEGMCWSVREMFSYGTELDRFIPHLQAMAEGLTRAHFATYDSPDGSFDDGGDNYSMFVVGLRPLSPEDKTTAQLRAEQRERDELELFAELKAKYEPAG